MPAGRESAAARVDGEGLHRVVGRDRFAERTAGPAFQSLIAGSELHDASRPPLAATSPRTRDRCP